VATLPDYDDFRQAAITEALAGPTTLTREIMEADGSEVGTAINIGAAMGEESAVYAQATLNETRLSTAPSQGRDALEQWVASNYGFTVPGPLSAIVTLVWTRDPSATPVTLEAGTVVSTSTGDVFELEEDLVINGPGPAEVVAVAQATGLGTNVAANTLTIPQVLPDPTLTVTNPEQAAGGSDGLSDDELQALAQGFFQAARRGTKTAILEGTLLTPGVAQASAFELLTSTGCPDGRGQVIIAGPNSQANTALANRVVLELEEWRGLGVPIIVIAGQPTYIDIVVTGLQFVAGVNSSVVLGTARRALVAAVNRLEPGKPLRQSLLQATLEGIAGLIVPAGSISSPAGDIIPSSNIEVLRTTLDRVSLN
jgi:uncharacterized phage protein gp47/JayE